MTQVYDSGLKMYLKVTRFEFPEENTSACKVAKYNVKVLGKL